MGNYISSSIHNLTPYDKTSYVIVQKNVLIELQM